jgi:hypothetical protein
MKYARIVPPKINSARPHNETFIALSADSLSIDGPCMFCEVMDTSICELLEIFRI